MFAIFAVFAVPLKRDGGLQFQQIDYNSFLKVNGKIIHFVPSLNTNNIYWLIIGEENKQKIENFISYRNSKERII